MKLPNDQAFLNKYYWEPNATYLGCRNSELYNEALLVLDTNRPTDNNKPYIREMYGKILDLLMSCFPNYPVHKTNRISIDRVNTETLSDLISSSIKPKVIITFSSEIGNYLRSNFQIKYDSYLRDTGLWKGMIRMNDKWFFVYSIPGLEQTEEIVKEWIQFMQTSTVFDFQTCYHINEIIKKYPDFRLPENPIKLKTVRKNLRRYNEIQFFSLPNLHPNAVTNITKAIKDFNIYDLVMAGDLTDWFPGNMSKSTLSKEHYIEQRKHESALNICSKYFNNIQLQHKTDIIQLSVIRFYLYMEYPQLSFDALWTPEKEYIHSTTDIIQGFEDKYNTFLANN
jgi:hypothetical protein